MTLLCYPCDVRVLLVTVHQLVHYGELHPGGEGTVVGLVRQHLSIFSIFPFSTLYLIVDGLVVDRVVVVEHDVAHAGGPVNVRQLPGHPAVQYL